MKRCLVTGATSQIGDCLLPLLKNSGMELWAWSRQPREEPSIHWQQADLYNPPAVPEQLDCLLHLAPASLLPDLLQRLPGPCRVIAISTCSVRYKADSASAEEREIAQRFRAAEEDAMRSAQQAGHCLTVLRVSMLYGLELDLTVGALQKFARRFRFLLVPGVATGLRQPVHVEDVAQAVMQCLATPATAGQLYELGGGEVLSISQMAERILRDNGYRMPVLTLPAWIFRLALTALSLLKPGNEWRTALLERAAKDQLADNAAAMRDFGYAPRLFDGRFVRH